MKLREYSLRDIKKGTRVLMRVDLNMPLEEKLFESPYNVRISAVIPDIEACVKRGAKVVLLSHRGRPGGVIDKKLSLKPVAKLLSNVFDRRVKFIDDTDVAGEAIKNAGDGSIILLENVRFFPGEKKNQVAFAKKLAEFGDMYINNAFATCHRKHASVVAITKYLPSFAGSLVHQEVEALSRPFKEPFVLVLGGVKLKTKIDVLLHLAPKAQAILLGGGLATSLLSVRMKKKFHIGTRALEKGELVLAKKVLDVNRNNIILPIDLIVGEGMKERKLVVKRIKKLKEEDCQYDIGPETIELYRRMLIGSKSVVWNGPLGYIEQDSSQKGTRAIAKTLNHVKGYTVVGGGETVAFLEEEKLFQGINFVSSGGGAMLTFLAGKPMPGLKVLKK